MPPRRSSLRRHVVTDTAATVRTDCRESLVTLGDGSTGPSASGRADERMSGGRGRKSVHESGVEEGQLRRSAACVSLS